jgi:hypothetical protein
MYSKVCLLPNGLYSHHSPISLLRLQKGKGKGNYYKYKGGKMGGGKMKKGT